MVSGHLQEKKGNFYAVLSFIGGDGKRKSKWVATGLPVKGNKKKAEAMLLDLRSTFVIETPQETINEAEQDAKEEAIPFSTYLVNWLNGAKPNIELSTYGSYSYFVKKMGAYFDDRAITLTGLEPKDIQAFYTYALGEWQLSANTVIHYHAIIRKSLQYATKMDMIPANPALKVDRPKKPKFVGSFYSADEINSLIEAVRGTAISLPVMFGAFYGLRRSEIVGLKWDAIDFDNRTITIKHTVVPATIDGVHQNIAKDRTKSQASMRSLPLVADFETLLTDLKAAQAEYKRLCGRSYDYSFDGYICVDEMGALIKPNFITQNFNIMLKKHGLRKIRFHDLRHSCASLLLANGVSLKEIQEWLGHSTFATTADTYAHLDKSSKTKSSNAMLRSGIRIGIVR